MVKHFSRKIILGAGGLSLICAMSVHGQEDYTQWTYSRNIVINTSATGYNIASALNNFPYLIRLNSSSFDFAQAKGKGQDIRFSNASNVHLSYQIAKWDSAVQSAALWVKVDVISGNNSTQYIRMYWGRSAAADSSKGSAVFSTAQGFAGVWHLDSGSTAADGSTQPYLDATGSGNNGYDFVNTAAVGGVSAAAALFSGGDYSSIHRPVQDDFTIAFWVKTSDNSSPTGTQWYQGNGMVDGEAANVVNDYGVAFLNSKAAFGTGNPDNTIQSATLINNGNWHFIAATRVRSSGAKILYVDGVQEATGTGSTNTLNVPQWLYFGALQTNIDFFYGVIDEVQISSAVRSADWIKLSNLNQKPVPPTSPPKIQYSTSEILLPPNQFFTPITPTYDIEQTDSITITPILFNYLTFDNATGTIGGWADGDQPRTAFIVRAYNAAGFGADTIYITVSNTSVRGSASAGIGMPVIRGICAEKSCEAVRILYSIPVPAQVREIQFVMYNLKGSAVWQKRLGADQRKTGTLSVPVKGTTGVYFVEMRTVFSPGLDGSGIYVTGKQVVIP